MKKIITKYNGKETEHLLLDRDADNCPICDTPLKDIGGSWNMFHGEVSAQCCKAPYQTKDYYVDPEKGEGFDVYFEELNKPNMWSLSVDDDWIEPLRQSLQELNETELTKEVQERAAVIREATNQEEENYE